MPAISSRSAGGVLGLRAYTLFHLLLGQLEVTALTSDLEQGETADGQDPGQTFRWSRSVRSDGLRSM